ncbi:aspartate aminotransferase family protein [Lichenihabitans psoromatis]|uniref:aspartate aminotransferase family protein n=1 Tax=Lichenihabitans psoromatis TaxID=2528642 RepID=UPI001038369A|nr:aspartate aminotransferase family protein [Lichenihabitans psoromatis]
MAPTSPIPGRVNADIPGRSQRVTAAEHALMTRRETVLGPAYRLFYEEPVHLVRGEGVWLYDVAGDAYLDVYNNVASLGHGQPDVVAAVTRQWATLNTHTRYLHETILDYAEKLLGLFPEHLGHVMFTCTGSEANDLAYRIAKSHTGGTGVIVTDLAYHGVTDAVSQFSPSLGAGVPRGPHVRTVRAPDAYRRGDADLGAAVAADVRAAIADLHKHGIKPAMMICDAIFSSDGVFADPPGFLAEAAEAVREAGALWVADEVQSGFGRTGNALWGFMRHGLEPDMVTLGKPMGNGQPIGGVVMRPEVVAEFGRTSRYFNTFGGSPVSCAAGLAVLEVIERDALVANARQVGFYLRTALEELANRHEAIGDVRGAGLFVGVEIVSDRAAKTADAATTTRVVNGLRRNRVLISASGPQANVLKLRPPIVFSTAHVDTFVAALDEVLSDRSAPPP